MSKLALGTLTANTVHLDYMMSVIALARSPHLGVMRMVRIGGNLAKGRKDLTDWWLNETDAEFLLMVDSDQHFTVEEVETLMRVMEEHPDVGVVGALVVGYQLGNDTAYLAAGPWTEGQPGRYHRFTAVPDVDLAMDVCMGTGMVLIRREAMAGLPENPWFHLEAGVSEDVTFMYHMSQSEYRTALAVNVQPGHIKLVELRPSEMGG